MSPTDRAKCPYDEALIDLFRIIHDSYTAASPSTRIDMSGALGLAPQDPRGIYDMDPVIVGHTIAGSQLMHDDTAISMANECMAWTLGLNVHLCNI